MEYCDGFQLEREDYLQGTKGNETELRRFADFISYLGLNLFTRELQSQIYERLQQNVPDLDELIQRQRAFGYHMATSEHEQKRTIDKLIETKAIIESNGIPVVETRKLDYHSILPAMK